MADQHPFGFARGYKLRQPDFGDIFGCHITAGKEMENFDHCIRWFDFEYTSGDQSAATISRSGNILQWFLLEAFKIFQKKINDNSFIPFDGFRSLYS